MHGYGLTPATFWEYVYAVCGEKYDMEEVKNIYVYGDGGTWITTGFTIFPKAVYVLDTFHYKKRIKSLLSSNICSEFAHKAYSAIKHDKIEEFRAVAQEMLDAVADKLEGDELEKQQKKIKEDSGYIVGHWVAIQNRRLAGSIGSCTEAMISHVLSERLSRNPMGWSENGLLKMAEIRVFCVNGGVVQPSDIGIGKQKKDGEKNKDKSTKRVVISNIAKYDELIKKQQDEVFASAKDWGIFSKSSDWYTDNHHMSEKRTGTREALRLIGQMRKVS
jgi:hypothetical protein